MPHTSHLPQLVTHQCVSPLAAASMACCSTMSTSRRMFDLSILARLQWCFPVSLHGILRGCQYPCTLPSAMVEAVARPHQTVTHLQQPAAAAAAAPAAAPCNFPSAQHCQCLYAALQHAVLCCVLPTVILASPCLGALPLTHSAIALRASPPVRGSASRSCEPARVTVNVSGWAQCLGILPGHRLVLDTLLRLVLGALLQFVLCILLRHVQDMPLQLELLHLVWLSRHRRDSPGSCWAPTPLWWRMNLQQRRQCYKQQHSTQLLHGSRKANRDDQGAVCWQTRPPCERLCACRDVATLSPHGGCDQTTQLSYTQAEAEAVPTVASSKALICPTVCVGRGDTRSVCCCSHMSPAATVPDISLSLAPLLLRPLVDITTPLPAETGKARLDDF